MIHDTLNPESRWIDWLLSAEDPLEGLKHFAKNYHYFSLHQIISFSKIMRLIEPSDNESLAEVGQVIFDELGEGKANQVHSILFQKFAFAVGVPENEIPLPGHMVLPEIIAYLNRLDVNFSSNSLPNAIASYVFLEESAVQTYEPLLDAFRSLPGLNPDALRFFEIHAVVERRHAGAAARLESRLIKTPADRNVAQSEKENLRNLWQEFWSALYRLSSGSEQAARANIS